MRRLGRSVLRFNGLKACDCPADWVFGNRRIVSRLDRKLQLSDRWASSVVGVGPLSCLNTYWVNTRLISSAQEQSRARAEQEYTI